MFTGIIEAKGKIISIKESKNTDGVLRLGVSIPAKWKLKLGQSVCVSGVCLTVVKVGAKSCMFEIIPETKNKTIFGRNIEDISPIVNLERGMVFGDRVDGHIVSGHVDTTGVVENIEQGKAGYLVTILFPKKFAKLVKNKGSVCLDGVSLTVAKCTENSLTVALIPYTLKSTTLGSLAKGDIINIEFDKYYGANKR